MNYHGLFEKTGHCLSVLGIVAKEQRLAPQRWSHNSSDSKECIVIIACYCSFATRPYARVCAGFAVVHDYLWSA